LATTLRAPGPRHFSRRATTRRRQPIVHKDGKVERIAATASGVREGLLRYGGIDDHYFASMLLNEQNTQAVRMDFAPNHVPQTDDPAIIGRYSRLLGALSVATGSIAILLRTEGIRHAALDRPRDDARHQLRHFCVARGAAARRAQVGAWLHRQLGLGDHRPDAAHQHRAVPAAPQERGLDAQDAGDPAADEGDPGSLRQSTRSPTPSGRR
jgi:hypothetical protein